MNCDIDNKKSWFVVIIWRPNVGKSSFVNAIIWEKVSIVTDVPQTTRKKILGIYNDEKSQIIFLDTPGIHSSKKEFNQKINSQATKSIEDADVVLYLVDPTRPYGEEEKMIESIFDAVLKPKVKVFTKSDIKKIPNEFSISSLTKDGFSELMQRLQELLPFGPDYYPEDVYTYQDSESRIEEIVREKIFLFTQDEIPHATYVSVEDIEDQEKLLRIQAYIYVETESQKKIVIGKNASLLSKIWKLAREELEEIFGKKIFLSLRVKVLPKWRENKNTLEKVIW